VSARSSNFAYNRCSDYSPVSPLASLSLTRRALSVDADEMRRRSLTFGVKSAENVHRVK